ncbi:hypothetical protein GXW82_14580 [Streptacidiphilus sp. 4-A2]|nr:hypothetical protein [Streptacidiphilus sp. 4-A2]
MTLVALSALWSLALSRYPTTGVPASTRTLVFCVHALLAGGLVGLSPWYGCSRSAATSSPTSCRPGDAGPGSP